MQRLPQLGARPRPGLYDAAMVPDVEPERTPRWHNVGSAIFAAFLVIDMAFLAVVIASH